MPRRPGLVCLVAPSNQAFQVLVLTNSSFNGLNPTASGTGIVRHRSELTKI